MGSSVRLERYPQFRLQIVKGAKAAPQLAQGILIEVADVSAWLNQLRMFLLCVEMAYGFREELLIKNKL